MSRTPKRALRVSSDDIPLIAENGHQEEDLMSSEGGEGDREWLVGRRRHRGWFASFRRCCGAMSLRRLLGLRSNEHVERTLTLGAPLNPAADYPPNAINNQKYNLVTFVPKVLWEQFKFFLNFYFLCMAISQFIPAIQVGLIWTYWAPLCFVLAVTMAREAWDDLSRRWRDRELNGTAYAKLVSGQGSVPVRAADLRVGDLVLLQKDQRIPADMILLRTSERAAGSCFIRTDQLDGETDWKLRIPLAFTQRLEEDAALFNLHLDVYADKPHKDIHDFHGRATLSEVDYQSGQRSATVTALNVENTLWADTVLASGTAVGLVVYTGTETRSALNTDSPDSKVGLLDVEVNNLTKILFVVVMLMALLMVCLKGFHGPWYRYFFRFVLLFSYIIPISLRVNLDMAKATYCWLVGRDKAIPGTVVRSSTIPEELGRLSYLLSDKTGTLTKNSMIFKKVHLGSVAFTPENFAEVREHCERQLEAERGGKALPKSSLTAKAAAAVRAIALCHNVTPIFEPSTSSNSSLSETPNGGLAFDNQAVEEEEEAPEADRRGPPTTISYQAASPDEVALVGWADEVGTALVDRSLSSIRLRLPDGSHRSYQILQTFPFTSESKRMGIILKEEESGELSLYMKGADTVMRDIVEYNDWLDEECSNMAREGLRTLVVGRKSLSQAQYAEWAKDWEAAKAATRDRDSATAAVRERLEKDLSLLAVTGVEDSLQDEVGQSLELMRNAGIKVWMLTGDKRETAICIAKSSGLFAKHEEIYAFPDVLNRLEAHTALAALRQRGRVGLVITGAALRLCLEFYEAEVAELVCEASGVVCCRCSPEQKAQLVRLLRKYKAPLRVAAVGDGGNDVAMIQAAHAGIGIVGKEGKQASLAADFSIAQFSFLCRLILVHGRYNYKRSSALAQFVMHRGMIISAMQAVFSAIFYFVSVQVFPSVLMVAYSTFYTNFPVFSLVLDKDASPQTVMAYPELYKELGKGRSLSFKTFFLWVLVSIYQGGVIMYLSVWLFQEDLLHLISIAFTALILTELIMVALTIHSWHYMMVLAETLSLLLYIASIFVLHSTFDQNFMKQPSFAWKTAVITLASCLPTWILKCLRQRFAPPTYARVN